MAPTEGISGLPRRIQADAHLPRARRRTPSRQARSSRFLALAALLWAWGPASAAGLCQAGETIFFACQLQGSDTQVAVCGSANPTRAEKLQGMVGWLQYRTGSLGAASYTYPDGKPGSLSQFDGAARGRRGSRPAAAVLLFRDQGIAFTLGSLDAESRRIGLRQELERVRAPEQLCSSVSPGVNRLAEALRLIHRAP